MECPRRAHEAVALAVFWIFLAWPGLPAAPAPAAKGSEANTPAGPAEKSGPGPQSPPSRQQEERYTLAGGKRLELRFTTTALTPARVYVRVNRGDFRVVRGGVLNLHEDGLYHIAWYAEDSVGNRSAIEERTVRIDSTPPVVSYSVRLVQDGRAEVRLQATDAGTEVAALEWRARGEDPWSAYSAPLLFPGEAPVALQARAVDALGNATLPLAIGVSLNRMPPQVRGLFREPYARTSTDDRIYVVTRELPIPANLEGYQLDVVEEGQPPRRLMPGGRLHFPTDGTRRLLFRLTDENGNSVDAAVEVIVDTRAPRSRPAFGPKDGKAP